MYVQGNNRYVTGTHCSRAFLFPIPAWCPVQKLRPIFLVDKSIHDEAIPFKNNLVNLTIPTTVVPIVGAFLYVVILAQSGVHGDNVRPEKKVGP